MLYIADTNGATIRAYNTATTEVTTLAGNGTPGYVDGVGGAVRVDRPRGLAFDGASLYWVEFAQQAVRQIVLPAGSVSTMLGDHCDGVVAPPCPGTYIEGTGIDAHLNAPWDIDYHAPSNSLFLFDSGNFVLRRLGGCGPDAREEDDVCTAATEISGGQTRAHIHCDDASDWRSFARARSRGAPRAAITSI